MKIIPTRHLLSLLVLGGLAQPLSAYTDWKQDYTGSERNTVVLFKAEDARQARTTVNNARSSAVVSATYATEGITTAVPGKFGTGFRVEELTEESNSSRFGYLQISGASVLEIERMREFTVEVWYSPLSEHPAGETASFRYLVDNQYSSKDGFRVFFIGGEGTIRVAIGNGEEVMSATSTHLKWTPGEWYHLAFTYDSRRGELNIYRNGQVIGFETRKNFGNVTNYKGNLRIGNRLGSHYGPLPGVYDNFRISDTKLNFRP